MAYPLTDSYLDSNGLQLFVSDDVVAMTSISIVGSTFYNPDAGYTGFGSDGNYYTAGVASSVRATWATEGQGPHRGPHNRFPDTLLAILTTHELVLVDAQDFTVFLRIVALDLPTISTTETPGIFLEWEEDASLLGYGTTLGVVGNTFSSVAFANGLLLVSTSNGTRVIDFREDRAYCLTSTGYYSARYPARAGLKFRNLPDYFGEVINPAITGPDVSLVVEGRAIGTYTFFAVGSATGVTVFRWSGTGMGALAFQDTPLLGVTRTARILSSGELYLLVNYDDAGSPRLKAVRSVSEWQAVSGSFSGASSQRSIPSWPGAVGFMDLAGDYLYIGVGSGIWRMESDLDVPAELAYGKTLTAVEPTAPLWDILPGNNSAISAMVTDITTGFLGVLTGNLFVIVDPGNHVVDATYSTSGDPELPATPTVLMTYNFEVEEVGA